MPDTDHAPVHDLPIVHREADATTLQFSSNEIQSRMQRHDPQALTLRYTRTMMGFLLFVPDPRRITMIGLGGGSLAKFCHRHLPRSHITAIEINPHVIALRDEFQVPADSERFLVVQADGSKYLREQPEPCDVLMVDGFGAEGMHGNLGSQRFYDDCFDTLAPGGLLVVNLHLGHPHYPLYVDRIRRSFNDVVLSCGDTEQSNSIVFALKGRGFAIRRTEVWKHLNRLDRAAAIEPLSEAFARVVAALRQQQHPGRPAPGRSGTGEA